jgi:UDP-MurNAc hydroxylase
MEIRFYGHACVWVKTDKVSVTVDPWFSKSGAFLSSWFQFPDNTDLDLTPIRNSDFIVLSHEHQDHVDLEFLRTINPKTKIVIPKFTDSYLSGLLKRNLTNEVQVLNSKEKEQISPDVRLCLMTQSVPIWDDCSVILDTPEGTILDVNDMKITGSDLRWIRENFQIRFLFMQFAPSAWHPYVYNYNNERKSSTLRHKTLTRFGYAKDIFLTSGAERFIPSAGPPCFLDQSQLEDAFLNEYVFSALPKFHEYAKEQGFADKISILLPGDQLIPDADYEFLNQQKLQEDAYAHTRQYLNNYSNKRASFIVAELGKIQSPNESLLEKCRKHFEPLISEAPYFRKKINGKMLLDITGEHSERILVDFTKDSNQVKLYEDEEFSWKFEIESRFLDLILEGKLTWEELLLSRRIRASRNPDIYNEFLIVFLRFRDRNSFHAYEKWDRNKSPEETFCLEYNEQKFRVQRYCPHARGDLAKGMIVNGELVCPGHGWTFSLSDGNCNQSKCSIRIELLEELLPD